MLKSSRRSGSTLYIIAMLATALLTACGAAVPPDPVGTPATLERPAGPPAPDFTIRLYQGAETLGSQQFSFAHLLGQGKPVVLNLWAGLCPPCRLEMPDFEEVHNALGDEVLLFGLDVGPFLNLGSSEDGLALLQSIGVTYPAGTTDDPEVVRAYELIGMPTTLFITPDGQIVRKWTGLLNADKLTDLVQDLIAVSATS
jgi:thiol-disulfide isomerase/thioredoxin